MGFDDDKVGLYRQDDGSWVAEIPALGGCDALMDTREAALAEFEQLSSLIAQECQGRGQALPKDTTEIVHDCPRVPTGSAGARLRDASPNRQPRTLDTRRARVRFRGGLHAC